MIFQKASTRTRVSFEVGMYQLGGYALFLSNRDLQIGRGEPVHRTSGCCVSCAVCPACALRRARRTMRTHPQPYAYSTLMVFVLPLRPLMMPPVMMTLSPFSSCITCRLTCSAW